MENNNGISREGLLASTIQSEGIITSDNPEVDSNTNITISKGLSKVRTYFGEIKEKIKTPILSLQRLMAQPPGCLFLGAQAMAANGWLVEYGTNPTRIVIDSGADITLISHTTLSKLSQKPKVKLGQWINLVQVIGALTISGFVSICVYFNTPEGPVELSVEAYVVKGMTTPFILGNNFADQYALSIIRGDDGTQLVFVDTGRKVPIENSIGSTFLDEKGHTFQIKIS